MVQNQPVSTGDPLVQIDDRPYQLVVTRAEAELEMAGQEIGAGTGQMAVAEAALSQARTAVYADNPETSSSLFTYFSFVTLTTLGYGDVVPLTPATQAWVAVQAKCSGNSTWPSLSRVW